MGQLCDKNKHQWGCHTDHRLSSKRKEKNQDNSPSVEGKIDRN